MTRRGGITAGVLGATAWLLLGAGPLAAQSLSGISVTKLGPPNVDNADLDRISFATLVSSSATSLQARMYGIHLYDTAEFTSGTATDTQANDYTVEFTATAPGDYQLTINTNFSGCMRVVDDTIFGGTATANPGGVTGFVELGPGLTTGTLNLPDPGTRTTPGETCFNPSATATIVAFSGGSGVTHRLRFQFTNQVISDDDEAAVKFGMASSQGGQTAGTGSGTGPSDGHFVNVTLTSFCGNGVVDTGVGEQCDPSISGSVCCTSACRFASASTTCRPSAGVCDPAETCTGSSATCPADAKSTAVCRAAADVCDVAESCDGVSNDCPADAFVAAGTECRAAAGDCDVAETCTGSSATCPADAFVASGTECRAAAGDCDLAETCTGSSATCPADAKSTAVCRAAADACDVAESCDGVNDACPADAVAPATTVCRAAADACDVAETCDGVSTACPADAFVAAGTECRAAAGDCDIAETCTGSSATCPADGFVAAGTECRAAAGDCDLAETCTGSSATCPADAKSTAVCRAAADACDVAESCDGVNDACPADGVAPATTVCRAAAGDCDIAETCDGVGTACPADAFQPASVVCRSAAGLCDVAENCTGSSATCPPDGGLPDADGDSVCDVADPCTNVASTGTNKPKLIVGKLLAPPNDETVVLGGVLTGIPATPTVDPVTKGLRIVVTDSLGATPIDVTIPGGAYDPVTKTGWKVNPAGTAWKYSGPGTATNGIRKVALKQGSTPGQYKLTVVGKGGLYPVNAANLPLVATVVLDTPTATTGQCAEATFPAVPPAKPNCTATGNGKTVKCK